MNQVIDGQCICTPFGNPLYPGVDTECVDEYCGEGETGCEGEACFEGPFPGETGCEGEACIEGPPELPGETGCEGEACFEGPFPEFPGEGAPEEPVVPEEIPCEGE